ncbi:MAG: glutathione S-transferase family protein [Pseudomonadota bacterium]
MSDLTLTIGDKNLSSWSFRPWFLMTQAGIPFAEENIKLDRPDSRKTLNEKSPSGLVPFLTHKTEAGAVQVWDSLAIAEYLNDVWPEKLLWPTDIVARAFARSLAAEMHSGFSALRTVWPMMFTREGLRHTTSGGVQRDIDRISQLWTEARTRFGANSPTDEGFLFGKLSVADAMYAPVVSRFSTYGPVAVSDKAAAYMEVMQRTDAWRAWGEGARTEIGV